VIDGLNQGDSRIPYRDSKLTRLLQDSLNPHSASSALMICCIAPSAAMASETCQSLTYASKVSPI
jgi:kinesin family protein 22